MSNRGDIIMANTAAPTVTFIAGFFILTNENTKEAVLEEIYVTADIVEGLYIEGKPFVISDIVPMVDIDERIRQLERKGYRVLTKLQGYEDGQDMEASK